MLTKLLTLFSHPRHSRDFMTVANVSKSMRIPLTLILVCGVAVKVLALHPILRVLAVTAFIVSVLYLGSLLLLLHREMALRALYRTKRLALPTSLAEGIAAGERMNVSKVAEVITLRISKVREFNLQSLKVFDCLMHDMLQSTPTLAAALRDVAKNEANRSEA